MNELEAPADSDAGQTERDERLLVLPVPAVGHHQQSWRIKIDDSAGASNQTAIAPSRAELGWRAAVLNEEARRHAAASRRNPLRSKRAIKRGASNQAPDQLDAAQHLTGGHVDGLWLRSLLQRLFDGECCFGAETGHCGNLLDCRGTQLLE